MTRESLKEHIFRGISTVVSSFQNNNNPYAYLYESDIQSHLFFELRREIPEVVNVPKKGGGVYSLALVYTEYLEKIDIVCLDPEAIEKRGEELIKPYKNNDTYIYNLPVFVGIELKYICMGYRKGIDIVKRDQKKLEDLQNRQKIQNWLTLTFIQRFEEAEIFEKNARACCDVQTVKKIDRLDRNYIVMPGKLLLLEIEQVL